MSSNATSFQVPYGCFWAAVVGLALEGCAGEFRRFSTPPITMAASNLDALIAQIGCVIIAALVFAMAIKRQEEPFAFARQAWGVVPAVCFTLGLALYFQEELFVAAFPALSDLGYFLVVTAGYLYLLAWFDRLMAFGARCVLMTVGASLALRGVLQAVLLVLQPTPSMCLLVVLPLVSLPFFIRVRNDAAQRDLAAVCQDNLPYKLADLSTRNGKIALGALLLVIALLAIQSNSGLSRTTFVDIAADGRFVSQIIAVVTNVVVGIALLGIAALRFRKVLLLAFFIAIVALVSFATFTANAFDSGSLRTLGSIALTGARKCLDFAVVLPAFLYLSSGKASFRWFVLARLASSGGAVLGSAVLSSSSTGVPLEVANVITGSLILALFITLIVLFVCLEGGEGAAAVPQPEKPLHRPFKESLEKIADDACLTPTETTVFGLIARGHNAESVRQELVISVNTAKTHIRNIYAKLGIHSQQELIALVNKTKEEIVREYQDTTPTQS